MHIMCFNNCTIQPSLKPFHLSCTIIGFLTVKQQSSLDLHMDTHTHTITHTYTVHYYRINTTLTASLNTKRL